MCLEEETPPYWFCPSVLSVGFILWYGFWKEDYRHFGYTLIIHKKKTAFRGKLFREVSSFHILEDICHGHQGLMFNLCAERQGFAPKSLCELCGIPSSISCSATSLSTLLFFPLLLLARVNLRTLPCQRSGKVRMTHSSSDRNIYILCVIVHSLFGKCYKCVYSLSHKTQSVIIITPAFLRKEKNNIK